MKITQRDFGNGSTLFSLTNDNGMTLEVSDFGARIVNLLIPVGNERRNIVLGFDSAEEYLAQDTYIGATIGRVAGRIKGGQFKIDARAYQAQTSEETGNTLHGGWPSFEEKLWSSETHIEETQASVIFSLTSHDGENGFPGNLDVSVTYSLNHQNEWTVTYWAQTDKATLYNPTNHVYFNLSGDVATPIDDHYLAVMADRFAVLNTDNTVTGEKRKLAGTAFDFRTAKPLKTCFEFTGDPQKDMVSGIDHPFFLTHKSDVDAILESPDKNVSIEVQTDQDTIVIFTANFGAEKRILHGKNLVNHGGITFETQAAPGAIEFEDFGNIVLRPDTTYQAKTVYKVNF